MVKIKFPFKIFKLSKRYGKKWFQSEPFVTPRVYSKMNSRNFDFENYYENR